MDEEQASMVYWEAVNKLQQVIDSGMRSSKEEILEELENDLE